MKEVITANSWDDFKKNISGLTARGKGDAFELLVKCYLQLSPGYASLLKNVWLYDEIPFRLHQKLNLPDRDMGIDLIAETKNGQYWAIQCKYRDNESKKLGWREISTFAGLAFSNKLISFALLCATSEKITQVLGKQENIGFRTIEVWRHLDRDFFDRVRVLSGNKPVKLRPHKPYAHQKRAIKNAVQHFIKNNESRGKLIMPCGTGKSLTACWIADSIQSRKTIVIVPSLSLLSQTLDVWLRERLARNREINWMAVCSDETVAESEKDELSVLRQDLGIPVATDTGIISRWLKENKSKPVVVFSTYQSGKVIARASSQAKIKYDLGIFDEAHKTVGSESKLFSHLLFDNNIRIARRVFMTATERRYAGGKNDKILSMDDPDIYGDTFELLSFKEALDHVPPILSDYKVATIAVSQTEIEKLIKSRAFVTADRLKLDREVEAGMLASAIALRKAMNKYPITHAVSFHKSIARSKIFQSIQDALSESFPEYGGLETFQVDGKMPSGARDRILNDFSRSKQSLISNARCLTEGVDVPNIDCVLFADPKQSRIDIVQAVGRALRLYKGKKFGYVIVPIIIKPGQPEATAYDEILGLLRALASNDERIIEYFRAKFNKSRPSGKIIDIDIDEIIARRIDLEEFISAVETRCWESLARLSWRPFEEARAFVHKLNLKSGAQWKEYCQSGEKPEDIPAGPARAYQDKGWEGMGDWLGTGTVATHLREYRPFKEARAFVHALNFTSGDQWHEYCRSGKKPEDIPAGPARTYKDKGWKGEGDWLGTGTVATHLREYRPFKEARAFVHALNLKSEAQWNEYCQSEKKPEDIPKTPSHCYKGKGWKNLGDWLGTGSIANQLRKYRPFEKARAFVHTLNLKNGAQWRVYCQSEKKPEDIPTNPNRAYKEKGWKGMGDWLGTGFIATRARGYRPFKEARAFVHALNLKSWAQWNEYCKSGKKPEDIPANPKQIYKDKGWEGAGDWLGTGTIATNLREYRPFKEARAFVRMLNLKSGAQWREYCKSGKKPEDIPNTPSHCYKEKGWKNFGDWLGTGTIAPYLRKYRPFKEARAFVHTLNLKSGAQWSEYCKNGKKPDDIPSTPERTYKDQGWEGKGDWLGTGIMASQLKEYRPFKEARAFVHILNLKSRAQWKEYCQSGKKPEDIPSKPERTYKYKGWKGMGDWLGKK